MEAIDKMKHTPPDVSDIWSLMGARITGVRSSNFHQQNCPEFIEIVTDKGILVLTGIYWDENGYDHRSMVAHEVEKL